MQNRHAVHVSRFGNMSVKHNVSQLIRIKNRISGRKIRPDSFLKSRNPNIIPRLPGCSGRSCKRYRIRFRTGRRQRIGSNFTVPDLREKVRRAYRFISRSSREESYDDIEHIVRSIAFRARIQRGKPEPLAYGNSVDCAFSPNVRQSIFGNHFAIDRRLPDCRLPGFQILDRRSPGCVLPVRQVCFSRVFA